MSTRPVACGVIFSMITAAASASADYASPGPLAYATSDLPASAGGAQGGKLVVPEGAGPYPILVTSHGFSAAADNQVGWAEHFASYGFVVVVPTFPNALSPDAQKDADIIRALVSMYGDPAFASPAKGKVDPARVGLEGHSAGGLATTIAAAAMKPQATVLFDPVDKDDLGKAAYATLCAPVLGIFADPSSCNNTAGWSAFKTQSAGPQVLFNVVASTHCDGENHPRALCGPFCGGAADTGRQVGYAKYATAFFLAHLKGDAAAAAALTQAKLEGDALLAKVAVHDAPSCATPPGADAGPAGDGGAIDSGAAIDGGAVSHDAEAPRDAASPLAADASGGGGGASAEAPSTNGGCACTVGASPLNEAFAVAGIGAIVLVGARRRARHPRG